MVKKTVVFALLFSISLFLLAACGNKQETGTKEAAGVAEVNEENTGKADTRKDTGSNSSEQAPGKAATENNNSEPPPPAKPENEVKIPAAGSGAAANPNLQESQNKETNTKEKTAGAGPEAPATKVASDAPVALKFSELYSGGSVRGMTFSEKLTNLAGRRVMMSGYMAPPLKPSFHFFVLTRQPMAICPFCSTDADWPSDIVLVVVNRGMKAMSYDLPLKVTGRLEIGSQTDSETGFVSQVRIYAEKVETIKEEAKQS